MSDFLPAKLLKLRKHYHYSQKLVADKCNIELLTYMAYENGAQKPAEEEIRKIAKFYHISYEELSDDKLEVKLKPVKSTEKKVEQAIKKEKIINFFKKNKYLIIAICLLIIIFIFIFKPQKEIPFMMTEADLSDRFDCSETSVIGIDSNGNFFGQGDNSNGQLDVDAKLYKVSEGATFTVGIDENGMVYSYGLLSRVKKEIEDWQRIVSIKAGDGHILALDDSGKVYCAGDDSYGQCDFKAEKAQKIFALPKASVLILEDGTIEVSGEVVGSSRLKRIDNLKDIDASDNNLIYLKENGTVDYYSKNKDYSKILTWQNIIDVACGNDFLAALDSDGKVYIAIDNYLLENEVGEWDNIQAIAAGDDYLVAYDGDIVKGAGRNNFKQFANAATIHNTLPQVSNVKANIDEDNVTLSFDAINNASGYLISINIGTGYSTKIKESYLTIPNTFFEDGETYLIHIVAIGEGEYEDSPTYSLEFTYHKPQKTEPTSIPEQSEEVIEMPFTLLSMTGMSRKNFLAYLAGLGIKEEMIEGKESENICSSNEEIVDSIEGISNYEVITTSELLKRKISYTYCILREDKH